MNINSGRKLQAVGGIILRYSLVFFLLFFGCLKWTADEARGVEPFIAHSPFLSWIRYFFGMQGASELIGVVELAIGVLIALRYWNPRLSAWGSVGAGDRKSTRLNSSHITIS